MWRTGLKESMRTHDFWLNLECGIKLYWSLIKIHQSFLFHISEVGFWRQQVQEGNHILLPIIPPSPGNPKTFQDLGGNRTPPVSSGSTCEDAELFYNFS